MSIYNVPKDIMFIIFNHLVIPDNDPEIQQIRDERLRIYTHKKTYYGLHPVTARHLWIRRMISTCKRFRDMGLLFRARTPEWQNILAIEKNQTKQVSKHNKCVKRSKNAEKRQNALPWLSARKAMIEDIRKQFIEKECSTLYKENTLKTGRVYQIASLPKFKKYFGISVKELLLNRDNNRNNRAHIMIPKSFNGAKISWVIGDDVVLFTITK